MLPYHSPLKSNDGLIYSVDNIVMDFYISNPAARSALVAMLDNLPIQYAVEVTHWASFRIGTFREQFSFQHQDKTSFWLGAILNSSKPEFGRVRLDFNPNKVAHHAVFQSLFAFLIGNTRLMHRTVKRFDLAVDIPIDRFSVFLKKDARAYSERRHGQEWTQYLGAKSSTVGRVKLYNKTAEAGLAYPLTRVEITLSPENSFEKIPWPTVYYLRTDQIGMDELKSTETERFILGAILSGYGSPNQLGRKTRVKITTMLEAYVDTVQITPQTYTAILHHLRQYTQGHINTDIIDPDQPTMPSECLPFPN